MPDGIGVSLPVVAPRGGRDPRADRREGAAVGAKDARLERREV